MCVWLYATAHFFVFIRVIGLPSEEDWPKDSPIPYSISWGPEGPCTNLLHNLDPDANDLLSVSSFKHVRRERVVETAE